MLAGGTTPVAMRTSWTRLVEDPDHGGALVLVEATDETADP